MKIPKFGSNGLQYQINKTKLKERKHFLQFSLILLFEFYFIDLIMNNCKEHRINLIGFQYVKEPSAISDEKTLITGAQNLKWFFCQMTLGSFLLKRVQVLKMESLSFKSKI